MYAWKKNFFGLIIGIYLIILLFIGTTCSTYSQPRAINGVMDLSAWDLKKHKTANLNGEWDFYFNETVSPDLLGDKPPAAQKRIMNVPAKWYIITDGHKLTINNVKGTFHLKVILKEKYQNIFLQVDQIGRYYDMYINDQVIKESNNTFRTGIATFSRKKFYYRYRPENNILDITIHANSYNDAIANVFKPIKIGLEAGMIHNFILKYGVEISFCGLLLVIIILCLFFFIDSKQIIYIYLLFIALFTTLKTLFEGEQVIYLFVNTISNQQFYRIMFFSGYALAISFHLYIGKLYQSIQSRKTFIFLTISCSLFLLIPLFCSISFITAALKYFYLFVILTLTYYIVIIIKNFKQSPAKNKFFICSIVILLLFIINDILHTFTVNNNKNLLFIGSSIFIFLQFFIQYAAKKGRIPRSGKVSNHTSKQSVKNNTLLNEKKWQNAYYLSIALTNREKEIAIYIINSKTYPEIADILYISLNTVKFHIKNIFSKAEINSKAGFIRKVLSYRPDAD